MAWLMIASRSSKPMNALFIALIVIFSKSSRVSPKVSAAASNSRVIEVALIVSMMLSAKGASSELARDTVFATVMIVSNGVIGICLLAGSIRHRVLVFRVEGTSPALAVLIALTVLTLVLPALTTNTPGPTFSTSQLPFAGILSVALYAVFLFVQMVRHRDYFLPAGGDEDQHVPPPSTRKALVSLGVLFLALVAVVVLAKVLSPSIEAGVAAASAPPSVVGIAISLLVLLPETSAAIRAAARNRMQTSLNLALGSALATIGLTIPAVAAAAIFAGLPLTLGLPAKETTLLGLTWLISVVTLAGGRATVLHGAVHLMVFAVFVFLSVVP